MSQEPVTFKEFERAGWTRAAEAYRQAWSRLTAQAIEPLLEAVQLEPGQRLLDVACGPGDLAAAALGRGARPTGVDLAPAMVDLARRLHPEIAFEEGDAEALPFAEAELDVVAMNFCAGHVTDPDLAFREAHRVLRRGGRYGFSWWAPPDEAVVFGIVYRAVETQGRSDAPVPQGPDWTRFSVAEECRRALRAAGFAAVESRNVQMTWRIDTPERLIDIMRHSTVRTAALLEAQPAEALERISHAVADEARGYLQAGAVELPMPCLLTSGVKR